MSRQTITASDAAVERLREFKRDGESWTETLNRAAEALEAQDGDGELGMNSVAVENVDEIARAAADEVENRMARR
jgi:predicted CopG family antitoxin